jgi:hypothetical protein
LFGFLSEALECSIKIMFMGKAVISEDHDETRNGKKKIRSQL